MLSFRVPTITTLASLLLFHSSAGALPNKHAVHASERPLCAKFQLPVTISVQNLIFNDTIRVDSNIAAVDWALDVDTWSRPTGKQRVGSTGQVDATYSIAAQLCVPAGTKNKGQILQIATHGGGFDSGYWDVQLKPEEYSYVRAAVAAGYSILTYDWLGVGNSDKPDAYDIAQLPVQAEVLAQLTLLARSGKIAEAAQAQFAKGQIPAFTKCVHVGHSIGSATTSAMLVKHPDISDGVILTAFIASTKPGGAPQNAAGWKYAPEVYPKRFGHLGSGYLVMTEEHNIHSYFFSDRGGNFDPEALQYAIDNTQPTTVGELLSVPVVAALPALGYKGPLQFFLAEYDLGICHGDCKGAYNLTQVQTGLYPNASVVEAYIQPGVGHGLTLHKNATAGYKVMFDFFAANGL